MAAVYRDQRIGGVAVYGDGLSPQYTGTVADLGFASALSTAAGTYTAPGAPAYNGTVDGLTFASALSTAAGSYVAPGDIPQLDAPLFDRNVVGLRARRIGQPST